jgi:bifunctional non-homologous end joining protein LigD
MSLRGCEKIEIRRVFNDLFCILQIPPHLTTARGTFREGASFEICEKNLVKIARILISSQPLRTYKSKRDFDSTKEPSPKKTPKKSKDLIFVVQKHDASHLHYDFRLELDGVLKSWVVPKGPSMNPADRRLAIQVEDHPLEYAKFEGIIPAGNYGAGTVEIWDHGTYSIPDVPADKQESVIRDKLAQGELSFVLHGEKLRGEFALVHIKTGDKDNQWLLLKKKQ